MNILVDKYNIDYIDEGKGETTCLFLHGWGASKENFLVSINLLKEKYRCVALDLPGFGKSDLLDRSFNVDDYVKIVIDFIEKLSIKDIIFFGHSFGGRIMIKINNIDNLTFNIRKNIFIDAAGIEHKKSIKSLFKIYSFKMMKNILYLLPGDKDTKEKRINDFRMKHGSTDYKTATPVLRETLVKTVNEDLQPLLKNIKKETLLIWGENDTDTPLNDGKIFEREIKGSGLVVLKGCGHFSFIEDQYTYLRVLKSYLLAHQIA